MQARDIMTSPAITVTPQTEVRKVAQLFLEKRISGAPVVDESGNLVGMVSEGDLLHRSEAGTGRRRSWWLTMFASKEELASQYAREHGRHVADIMTRRLVTVRPDTLVQEIAWLLERNGIKRVPVIENGKVIGLVSRANLIQAVASAPWSLAMSSSDQAIRETLVNELARQPWADLALINITVSNGVVGLWGVMDSEAERKALKVAAESTPGVVGVADHLMSRPFAA
jgi:CBS-domain-containing membrane protein